MEITIGKKITVAFFIPIMLLVSLGLFFYQNCLQSIEYTHWVARTVEVTSGIINIRSNIKDMETGQRGYVITGQESYLGPYYAGLSLLGPDINSVRELIKDNPVQQKRLILLQSLIAEKAAELKKAIGLRRTQGFGPARDLVMTNLGNDEMENIRDLIKQMISDEYLLLQKRTAAQQAGFDNLRNIGIVGILLTFFFSLATSFLVYRVDSDMRELKRIDNKIRISEKELQRSNQELERFAYIASHDLQEPLRMVASFTQLLERKYKDQLDAQAKEYIEFAVDGAKRMQTLIDDLLTFSKVGQKDAPRTLVDLNKICRQISEDMKMTISDNHALVQWDPLPILYANETQMNQLFLNLISNGMKYHSERPPVIKISSQKQTLHRWQFSVSDNGIGIDEKYFGKLFIIFQRLHSRKEYKGTGIGLALCKKIVENYNGHIWVESKIGEGTIFHFILNEGEMHEIH